MSRLTEQEVIDDIHTLHGTAVAGYDFSEFGFTVTRAPVKITCDRGACVATTG